MRLRDFLMLHDSQLTYDSDTARTEFDRRQSGCKRLADRLHRLVIDRIDRKYPHLTLRENAFYGYDPASDRGGERFFALVTPVTKKKRGRLLEKLRVTFDTSPDLGNDNWWWHAKDLARFRIVTANLDDLLALRKLLTDLVISSEPSYPLYFRDVPKDFIWVTQNERHNASKSMHFLLCDADDHIVEIQVMTLLQYSWDQIQHWLYEIQRSAGPDLPKSLRDSLDRSYWALSNSLFVLDEYILALGRRRTRAAPKPLGRELRRFIRRRSKLDS